MQYFMVLYFFPFYFFQKSHCSYLVLCLFFWAFRETYCIVADKISKCKMCFYFEKYKEIMSATWKPHENLCRDWRSLLNCRIPPGLSRIVLPPLDLLHNRHIFKLSWGLLFSDPYFECLQINSMQSVGQNLVKN